jgi:hypothetical protein
MLYYSQTCIFLYFSILNMYYFLAIAAISKGLGDTDDMSKTRYSGGSDRVSLTAEAHDLNFGSQLNNYMNDIYTFFCR